MKALRYKHACNSFKFLVNFEMSADDAIFVKFNFSTVTSTPVV